MGSRNPSRELVRDNFFRCLKRITLGQKRQDIPIFGSKLSYLMGGEMLKIDLPETIDFYRVQRDDFYDFTISERLAHFIQHRNIKPDFECVLNPPMIPKESLDEISHFDPPKFEWFWYKASMIECLANHEAQAKSEFENILRKEEKRILLKDFDSALEICDDSEFDWSCEILQNLLDCATLSKFDRYQNLLENSKICEDYFSEFEPDETKTGIYAEKSFDKTSDFVDFLDLGSSVALKLKEKFIKFFISNEPKD